MAEKQPGKLTEAQALQLLGVAPAEFRQMVRFGFVPKPSGGGYPLVAVVQGAAKYLREGACTQAKAADELGVSKAWVSALAKSGLLKPAEFGGVRVADVFRAQIEFMRDESRRSSKSQAASRMTDRKVELVEVLIAERTNKLFDEAEERANAIIDTVIGGLRSDLGSVPARVTAHIETRRKIEDEIDNALSKAADREALRAERAAEMLEASASG